MNAPVITYDSIINRAHDLAELVRRYCRGHVDLWRQIPYLAYMVDGRPAWNIRYADAYEHGLWNVWGNSRSCWYSVAVDLATGDILNHGEPALDDEFGKLAYRFDLLQPADILRGMRRTLKMPLDLNSPHVDTEEKLIAYKRSLGHEPPSEMYERTSPLTRPAPALTYP